LRFVSEISRVVLNAVSGGSELLEVVVFVHSV